MPHGGASSRVQIARGGASERVERMQKRECYRLATSTWRSYETPVAQVPAQAKNNRDCIGFIQHFCWSVYEVMAHICYYAANYCLENNLAGKVTLL